MEHINSVPNIYGTMHWDDSGHVSYGRNTPCTVTSYHVYAVEWDANAIRWYLDSIKYSEGNIANGINGTSELHAPFFLLLNMAIGGDWPGSPDAGTPFPDTMFVDYVRVYQVASGVQQKQGRVVRTDVLEQNYPNPFNPTTTIGYRLSATGHVVLTVYDVLGRAVATLKNGIEASGYHTVEFDGSQLPTGVYFYRIQTRDVVQTKRLVNLR
jgi:beta-glucanase (GH16 family)